MKKLIHFESGLDYRTRQAPAPTVARFTVSPGVVRFVVIGTDYGHIHTTGGEIRTWNSYSGARRFLNSYVSYRNEV